MKSSSEKYFVEHFHLHSPIEEFHQHSLLEIERLHANNPKFDDSTHRQAVDLVLRKIRSRKLSPES